MFILVIIMIFLFTVFFRCFAAIGDVSKARYLRGVSELANQISAETVNKHSPLLMAGEL